MDDRHCQHVCPGRRRRFGGARLAAARLGFVGLCCIAAWAVVLADLAWELDLPLEAFSHDLPAVDAQALLALDRDAVRIQAPWTGDGPDLPREPFAADLPPVAAGQLQALDSDAQRLLSPYPGPGQVLLLGDGWFASDFRPWLMTQGDAGPRSSFSLGDRFRLVAGMGQEGGLNPEVTAHVLLSLPGLGDLWVMGRDHLRPDAGPPPALFRGPLPADEASILLLDLRLPGSLGTGTAQALVALVDADGDIFLRTHTFNLEPASP